MLKAISGEITSQPLNDNFSYLDSNKIGKDTLQFIDIQEYGAIGDGITDNAVAIKAAMDAADGRLVVIPHGNFVSSQVNLNANQKVIIIGNLIAEVTLTGSILFADAVPNVKIYGQGGKLTGNTVNSCTGLRFKTARMHA